MNTIKVKEYKNHTIKIVPCEVSDSPREWSNLGKMLYLGSRYTLGDELTNKTDMQAIVDDKEMICLPVYAYIHGSIALNTTGYSCRWDSGQCGIIYVSKEVIRKEWKVKRISKKLLNTVLDNLRSEVHVNSQYINGEVYGFQVENSE